jgi:hypothetical protein
MCNNAFTSLLIVLFIQNHTIRLITQAQRGFLFFLMVDRGIENMMKWPTALRACASGSTTTD